MSTDASRTLSVDVGVEHVRGGDGAFNLDVRFEVPPGITILFGPSGAGKSTTLAAITGLVRPTRGRVTLGDQVWFDAERRIDCPIHARGVSFVFQSLALFPHMTALANVAYGIDRSVRRAERIRRAQDMLDRMHVGHLAKRRPATFSGGEAQRVALARAFARQPRLVILDEAFSALDSDLRRQLTTEASQTIEALRIPAIQVTHRRSEARQMGARVVMLRHGRVHATGPVSLLDEAPAASVGGQEE